MFNSHPHLLNNDNISNGSDVVVIDVLKDVPKFLWNRSKLRYVLSARPPSLIPTVQSVVNVSAERFLSVVEVSSRQSEINKSEINSHSHDTV